MSIKLTNEFPDGTSLRGYCTFSYPELIEKFGEPNESDGYKVSGEWTFEDSDGNRFTIYDWKCTALYDSGCPAVSELREQENVRLHIGGHPGVGLMEFTKFLSKELDRTLVIEEMR